MKIRTINAHCAVVYRYVNSGVGIETTVFSYDTPVLRIDSNNNISRLWDGWSATTQRDINTAVNVGMNKKMWEAMPVVD